MTWEDAIISSVNKKTLNSLKEMRTLRKMSQYELADRTGMPQPNIARLEKEIKQGVELCTLNKLSIALSCNVVISGHSIKFVEK